MKIDREKVWLKYDKHCAYCGKEIKYKDMQVDHVTPKALANWYKHEETRRVMGLRGDNIDSFENLMPSCRRCNHYKRASTLQQFREQMKTIHKRFSQIYIIKVAIDYGIITVNEFDGVFYFERINDL